jgi:hypothetical protein
LIIAVIDMAAFGELYLAAQASPGLFTPQGFLLGAAAVTSFLAALLMLTQRSLKRLLVLSTVEDIGFLLLGVASLNALGIKGVVFAASTHALAKALLFICLSGPEADGALEGEPRVLAVRLPSCGLWLPLWNAIHARHSADHGLIWADGDSMKRLVQIGCCSRRSSLSRRSLRSLPIR